MQHNEMRPRSSRKDHYDTSGTPKVTPSRDSKLESFLAPKKSLVDLTVYDVEHARPEVQMVQQS